ncbi:MAG: autotransporter assembly complex family protein [Burkholderiaceae bacterium]
MRLTHTPSQLTARRLIARYRRDCLAWLVCSLLSAAAVAQSDSAPPPAPEQKERGVIEKVQDSLSSAKTQNYQFTIDAPEPFAQAIRRQTFVGRWQDREDYDPVQFDGLVARLHDEVEALLQADGYFSPTVNVSASDRSVSVSVKTGPQTRVSGVEIDIDGAVSADTALVKQLSEDWSLREGDPYTASGWESNKRKLLIALKQAGYLRAEIQSSALRINRQKRQARMTVKAQSGSPINFGELSIDGLSRYDASIVENLRTFAPGDRFNQATLLEFQSRLRSSGFFEEAGVLPDLIKLSENPKSDRVDLQVTVLERQSKRAGFGIGYSTDEGIRGQLGFEHRDLFNRNWQLESALVMSARRQRTFANVRTPYNDRNYFWGFGGRLEREDIEGQTAVRSNVYFGRGRRVGDTESFLSLQDQNEKLRIDGTSELPGSADTRRALVLGYTWSRRRLDSLVDPRRGYTLSAQLSGAHEALASNTSFVRTYVKALRYVSFAKRSALENSLLLFSGEVGYVAADTRQGIPTENLFRTGGGQSIRGYRYLSLGVPEAGGVTGGRYLAVVSAEYQYRLNDMYSLAAFFDYGNAADTTEDFEPVAGYGIGVRARTPIGPINLDIGYGEAEKDWQLHFSVGYSF